MSILLIVRVQGWCQIVKRRLKFITLCGASHYATCDSSFWFHCAPYWLCPACLWCLFRLFF